MNKNYLSDLLTATHEVESFCVVFSINTIQSNNPSLQIEWIETCYKLLICASSHCRLLL